MKKTISIFALALLFTGAFAQDKNLNPTVEVTNAYKREASGIEKPSQLRQLPDSVQRFDYDFDYSVRSTPYRGAYEFKPYKVQLRPALRPSEEGSLYARAGLGYGLHPEISAVWTPLKSDRTRLNVYGGYNGFLGRFRDIRFDGSAFAPSGDFTPYYRDRVASLGTDFRFDWKSGSFMVDAGYTATAGSDVWADVQTHGLKLNAVLAGKLRNVYSYGVSNRLVYSRNPLVKELHNTTSLNFGMPLAGGALSVGLKADVLNFANASLSGTAALFELSPAYSFVSGRLSFRGGLRLGFMLRSDAALAPGGSGIIYPDVDVSYVVLDEKMTAFATATGGDRFHTFEGTLSSNHFLGSFGFTPDVSVMRIKTTIGVKGTLWSRLQYNVHGGYYRLNNALGYGYSTAGAGYTPIVAYMCPLNSFFGSAELLWSSQHLKVHALVYYQHTLKPSYQNEVQKRLFSPAPLMVDVDASYVFAGRFTLGADVQIRGDKASFYATLPGYTDLGLDASFKMNRHWNFWARLGNILNQSIQRTPFHAEEGLYFTLGAELTF